MICGCGTVSGTLSESLLTSMSPGENCICAYMMNGRSAFASSRKISALPMPINPKVFTLLPSWVFLLNKKGKLCNHSAHNSSVDIKVTKKYLKIK